MRASSSCASTITYRICHSRQRPTGRTEWLPTLRTSARFFSENNVRVVNMSWGDQVSEFEQWLAKTASISDPQERKAKAQELYSIWRAAVAKMIEEAPGTLFVAAAGNGDNDASFAQDVPASFDVSEPTCGWRGESGRRRYGLHQLWADRRSLRRRLITCRAKYRKGIR